MPESDSTRTAPYPSAGGEVPAVPGYELLEHLGTGGMGVVWKARQAGLNRFVALKMIHGGRPAGPKELVRFLAEAEAVAAVRHPHVVQVYEFGDAGGRPFLAMEYLPGGSLADRLKRDGRLPPADAAGLVEKVARAVQAVHERQIVHRDLKPSNVLFDEAGGPKVADFGLAKRGAGSDLTRTQAVLGTPAYMAPEQADGKGKFAGPAADVWALGVILYECLTGKRPFDGADPWEVLWRVQAADPARPRALAPGLPADAELVCLKCLEKRPARRYPTAADLADDLRRFRTGEPIAARPVGRAERARRWCRRNPVPAGLAVIVAGLLLAASAVAVHLAGVNADLLAARSDAQAKRDAAVTAAAAADAARSRAEAAERLAQERLALAYTRTGNRAMEEGDAAAALLWFVEALAAEPDGERRAVHRLRLAVARRQLPRLRNLRLLDTPCDGAELSPDGTRVATVRTGPGKHEVRVWDTQTGQSVAPPLVPPGSVTFVRFSPDGRRLAIGDGRKEAVQVWDPATGKPVTPPMRSDGKDRLYGARFSPDGNYLAANYGATGHGTGHARVWDARTGQPVTPPLMHEEEVKDMSFSPDGRHVVTAGEDGTARIWDARTGLPTVSPLKHTQANVHFAVFSPDGSRVLTGTAQTWANALPSPGLAQVWDAATGRAVTPPVPHDSRLRGVRFSPDGRRFLTVCLRRVQVWAAEDGKAVTPPLDHPADVRFAAFGGDGRLVTGCEDHTVRLWDARTGLLIGGPCRHGRPVAAIDFAAGGGVVSVTADPVGGAEVRHWEPAPEARPVVLRHADTVRFVTFSPDGRRVATAAGNNFQSDPSAAWVWDAATGRPITKTGNHDSAVTVVRFRPDGAAVVTAGWDGTARVWDARTGAAVGGSLEHRAAIADARFSPDGRQVATASFRDDASRTDFHVWDPATGRELRPRVEQPWFPPRADLYQGGNAVSFSPTGDRVLTATVRQVRLHDAATGNPLSVRMSDGGTILAFRFTTDGRPLHVTAAADYTARLWDTAAGRPLTPALRHDGEVTGAAIAPDGGRVLTVSTRTVRVWDAATGELLSAPMAEEENVGVADFSPDGRLLATGVISYARVAGHARVWDPATGQPITPRLRHGGDVDALAFSPDGRRLATAGSDRTARLWDLSADDRTADDLRQLAGLIHGHRLGRRGEFMPLTGAELRAAFETVMP